MFLEQLLQQLCRETEEKLSASWRNQRPESAGTVLRLEPVYRGFGTVLEKVLYSLEEIWNSAGEGFA